MTGSTGSHTHQIANAIMTELNPYSPPSESSDTRSPTATTAPITISKLSANCAYASANVSIFGLLIRYGYPSLTGPIWYYAVAPSLALIAIQLSQLAFATRSHARVIWMGLPMFCCLSSLAIYAIATVPFAQSPMVYFDLRYHLAAVAIGTIALTAAVIVFHGSMRGMKRLILVTSLSIFFGATALGDLLSFVFAN